MSSPPTAAVVGAESTRAGGDVFQPVRVSFDSYEAHIGVDTRRTEWPQTIKKLGKDASKYVLLTDTNLDTLYGQTLLADLKQVGLDVLYLVLPPGEQTKSRETKSMIEDWMFAHHCGRDTVVIALGGGVMGDLCGYVASGYMRGVPFIQLPTSILAMVDSSLGSKTGIDTPAGKNLLGAFHRPLAVLIDLSLILTLPKRELCNGLAESIKAGVICSLELFELMEANAEAIIEQRDLTLLARVVEQSVAIKAHVVLHDEKEAGLRAILNFGHSIGHAIEAFMQPALLHGECVSIGMIEEILLSRAYGLVGSGELRRVDNVLKSYLLPTRVPSHLTAKQLVDKMSIDKKNKGGRKEIVLVNAIGSVKREPKCTTMVPDDDLLLLLSESIGVDPVSKPIVGTVSVPGSKSLSNRVLLLAAMGRGPCIVRGLLHSQDTQVMLESLRALGVRFEWLDGLERLRVHGCEGRLRLPSQPLFLNNAGTASRFLTTLACLVPSGEVTLTGNARMQERPIADLVDSLRACGNSIEYVAREGCLPIRITTGAGAGLRGGEVRLKANISSQYVSSLLLSAPHATETDLLLRLDQTPGSAPVSKPFIDMTVALMRQFGIDVAEIEPLVYRVRRGAYDNPPEFQVEGDASSATYPLALAAVSGGEVTVDNVGAASLQGDARFCGVLRDMGCTVTQTATTTTVRGPDYQRGESLKAISIDMDSMTDTFMTLAAVAVFATGTTSITNIANQRVKECNRLAVTVEELNKIGVKATETETGLDIVGVGLTDDAIAPLSAHVASLAHATALIECHDDHRIAMSFGVVGSRVRGLVLDEKRCVDKTYPEFWEHLAQKFGINVRPPPAGVGRVHAKKTASVTGNETVICIGMRASGKSTLGACLANHLRRPFLDLDTVFESEAGVTVKEFVTEHGWPAFRVREIALFQRVVADHPTGHVISCGGGIVESPLAIEILRRQPCVIQLVRHIDDVVAVLDADLSRPALAFDARAAWERRRLVYKQASRFEFYVAKGDFDMARVESDFLYFVDSILRPSTFALVRNTFFLSLTLPTLAASTAEERVALRAQIDKMTRGADSIEVRADLITPTVDEEVVKTYIATLRSVTRLPLIYTVRSKSQGGAFADYTDDASAADFVRQIEVGFRIGCELIDIEAALPAASRASLYATRRTRFPAARIISSHHVPRANGGSAEDLRRLFDLCANAGGAEKADVAKVVVLASDERDAVRITHVADEVAAAYEPRGIAVIALAMGAAGRLSRVCNRVLTPVTHPLLPTAAAPGQLSIAQIMEARAGLGIFPFDKPTSHRKWVLFGSPITYSMSPLLQNTAFQWNQVSSRFEYIKQDTSDIADVAARIRQPDFGGANVTIPLKEAACALVDSRSPAVEAIGALNTIVVQADGKLHGENVDWAGIHECILKRLPSGTPSQSDVAVVIGAGGTARASIYALQQLGFKNEHILVYNPRTKEKAQALAANFNATPITTLDRATITQVTGLKEFTIRSIVSTIPGSARMQLEDPHLLDVQVDRPIVFDASYIPADTAFLVQCQESFGVPAGNVVRGLDLLIAQGNFGMALWLGKTLPISCQQTMDRVVREAYAIQQAAK